MTGAAHPAQAARGGFSIVELVVALVVLSIGLMAMAGATTVSLVRVRGAKYETQRAAVTMAMADSLRSYAIRSAGFTALASRAVGSSPTVQGFQVGYTVSTPSTDVKLVRLYSRGPRITTAGYRDTTWDSTYIRLYRPYP